MSVNRGLMSAARLVRDHLALGGVDQYCAETGIQKDDFIVIEPKDFEGEIYAIDGSNAVICDWSVANLNLIRAGYAIYKGRSWQKTVINLTMCFGQILRITEIISITIYRNFSAEWNDP